MNFRSACSLPSCMKSQNHFIEQCAVLDTRLFLCYLYILYKNVAGYNHIVAGDFFQKLLS